ncbi:MAG: hypothetical protein KU37_04345 [Sulfuricurvum sp. PC08-66]|nr:MAG: hypothetical protein KU37_04345 [Sulfuricurvum sp. PC08-66]
MLNSSNNLMFYFTNDLPSEIGVFKIVLRTEEEYDNSLEPDKEVLSYIKQVSNYFSSNTFLLIAGDYERINGIRTYKGLLYKYKEYKNFKVINYESKKNDLSRLVSLIDITNYDYKKPLPLMLSWIRSIVIFTTLDIETIQDKIKNWVSTIESSPMPFDFHVIGSALKDMESTAVLRYFVADNGRSESVVIIGNKNMLKEKNFLSGADELL